MTVTRASAGGAAWSLVAIAGAIIALATLVPTTDGAESAGSLMWCLACGDFGLADAVANVVLFVPLGWALSRAGVRPGVAIAVVVSATIGIEFAQYAFIAGRVASLSDVVMNTAGGAVGIALPRLLHRLRTAAQRTVRAVAVYAGLLAVGLWVGVALQAISISDALRWTQERPRLPGYTDFTGSVRAVAIDGMPVAQGAFLTLTRRDSVEIAGQLVSGVPDPRRAEIVGARLRGGSAWMWLDAQGQDVRAYVASASDRFRLRGHFPILPAALPAAAGAVVVARFAATSFSYRFVVTTVEGTVERRASISPGDGWRLFLPFERRRERWAPVLDGLWMAALLSPLGYLAASRSRNAAAVAASGAVVYLLLLPVALGCAWLSVSGWCGAAAGFLGGVTVANLPTELPWLRGRSLDRASGQVVGR